MESVKSSFCRYHYPIKMYLTQQRSKNCRGLMSHSKVSNLTQDELYYRTNHTMTLNAYDCRFKIRGNLIKPPAFINRVKKYFNHSTLKDNIGHMNSQSVMPRMLFSFMLMEIMESAAIECLPQSYVTSLLA